MGVWSVVINSVATDFEDLGFYVTASPGTGMPAIENIVQEYGTADGGFHQRTVARPRTFALVGVLRGSSLSDLNDKRLALINALKRDRAASDGPLELRYTGNSGATLAIFCRYVAGLELGEVEGAAFEQLTIRFQATDPFFYSTSTSTSGAMGVTGSVANANNVIQKTDGIWQALATGVSGGGATVYAIVEDASGDYYIGGDFTAAGATSADYLAKFDTSAGTFSVVKSATSITGIVRTLAIAANGDLYIGGDFENADGIANADRIVKYTPGTDTYAALSTGATTASSGVYALAFDSAGDLYVGGTFNTVGGVGGTNGLAKWNGSAFSALTDNPAQFSQVLALLYDIASDTLYISDAADVYAYDVGASASSDLAYPGQTVHDFALAPNGDLYVAATTTGNNQGLWKWDGANWLLVGQGFTSGNHVRAVAFDDDGLLWLGGAFTVAGDGTTLPDGLAVWDGARFYAPDVLLPGSPTVYEICVVSDGSVVVGYNTAGTATRAASAAIGAVGSATAYPTIAIENSTAANISLYEIANATQGTALRFPPLVVLPGETVTIDLSPGAKSIMSNWRGNLISALSRASDLATFGLVPGTNSVTALASSSSLDLEMTWYARYWSLDA